MGESEALRILSIERDPLYAELVQSTLLEGGIDCEVTQVHTGDDFAAALGKGGFDLILSDYWLPSFDAHSALKMAREAYPEVPFILVAGAIGEERAIEALKTGATDYVLKHRLERLVPTVRRAIREARERDERRWAEETLGASEEQFRATFEQAAVGMAHTALDGSWLKVNQRLCDILGYTREELLQKTFQDITHPDDLEADLEQVSTLLAGEISTYSMEKRYIKKDSSTVWGNLTMSLVREPSGEPSYFIAIIEDITDRKQAEEELHQSARLCNTVFEQVAEHIFLIDVETKRILESNTSFRTSLGYTADELRQLTLYDFVAHDKESIDRNIQHVMEEGYSLLGERKYRCKDGSLVDVEVNVNIISYGGREAMCVVAHNVTERKQIEEDFRQSLSILLALRAAGHILGSTLESEEIVSRLLEIMRRVSSLTAAVISTPDEDGHLRIWRSVGLEGLWRRARFSPEAEAARRAVLENEESELFQLQSPYPEIGSLVGLCLPLNTRHGVIGVLEAYGPELLTEGDTIQILSSLANQAASALENAQLYGELAKRERRLQELVGKLLGAQEEERRRVAYEVHDSLAQVAYSAYQHLQAYGKLYPPASQDAKEKLDRGVSLVQQTVKEARSIIADLRPTVLDDFGLAAAVSQEIERLREEGYQVDYEEELGDERLPVTAEITFFRVTQEALTNVRKHAHTRQVCVELWRREEEAYLEIRDFGQGFELSTAVVGGEPGERVGLAGMQERVGMLGGELQIHSKLGVGTSIRAKIPLPLTAEQN